MKYEAVKNFPPYFIFHVLQHLWSRTFTKRCKFVSQSCSLDLSSCAVSILSIHMTTHAQGLIILTVTETNYAMQIVIENLVDYTECLLYPQNNTGSDI